MTQLNPNQVADIMRRFPTFELSYETVSHKKVSSEYDVCLAIPYGKKAFLWFTFFQDNDVCFLMELGREKKVSRVTILETYGTSRLALGTLFYCSMVGEVNGLAQENEKISISSNSVKGGILREPLVPLIVEDILYWQGISLAKLPFCEKLGFLDSFFQNPEFAPVINNSKMSIRLPVMWTTNTNGSNIENTQDNTIPGKWSNRIPYTIHHLQYRSLVKLLPHINIQMTKSIISNANGPVVKDLGNGHIKTQNTATNNINTVDIFIPPPLPKYDFTKPQYKMPTIFEVKADLQNDIYHLYAYGQSSQKVYYGLANIPNYKTSVFMNGLFRNIKENRNLDSLEESDDEEDFQDMRIDKFVNLDKTMTMECAFNNKFKRWVPVRVIPTNHSGGKIVHISKLVYQSEQYQNSTLHSQNNHLPRQNNQLHHNHYRNYQQNSRSR